MLVYNEVVFENIVEQIIDFFFVLVNKVNCLNGYFGVILGIFEEIIVLEVNVINESE